FMLLRSANCRFLGMLALAGRATLCAAPKTHINPKAINGLTVNRQLSHDASTKLCRQIFLFGGVKLSVDCHSPTKQARSRVGQKTINVPLLPLHFPLSPRLTGCCRCHAGSRSALRSRLDPRVPAQNPGRAVAARRDA